MPSSHEGEGEDFSFQLKFNQKVTTKYRVMEDHVFEITNGRVSDARRVDKRRDLWKITIEPNGEDDVVVTLPAHDNQLQRHRRRVQRDEPGQAVAAAE